MGGFLGGLTELLGGFAAKKQIDQSGFDYAQKRAQEEFLRQQEQLKAQQTNEDWATKAATEADLGAGPGQDISSTIAPYVNKQSVLARARGAGLQSRSSLKSQDLYNKQIEQQQKAADALKLQDDRQAAAMDVVNTLETQKRTRPLSPGDEARLQAAKEIAAGHDAARRSGGGGGRPSYSPPTINDAGEAGRWTTYPDGQKEWLPASPTTTMRDTSGMATAIRDSLDVMEEAAKKGITTGPIAGRLSKIWQAAYPSGAEGEFDAAANRLVDIVYLKSGKQINQNEMKILTKMIPNRARGNIDFQIKQFEDYADSLLSKYPQKGIPPTGGKTTSLAGGVVKWGRDASGNPVRLP